MCGGMRIEWAERERVWVSVYVCVCDKREKWERGGIDGGVHGEGDGGEKTTKILQ